MDHGQLLHESKMITKSSKVNILRIKFNLKIINAETHTVSVFTASG